MEIGRGGRRTSRRARICRFVTVVHWHKITRVNRQFQRHDLDGDHRTACLPVGGVGSGAVDFWPDG